MKVHDTNLKTITRNTIHELKKLHGLHELMNITAETQRTQSHFLCASPPLRFNCIISDKIYLQPSYYIPLMLPYLNYSANSIH